MNGPRFLGYGPETKKSLPQLDGGRWRWIRDPRPSGFWSHKNVSFLKSGVRIVACVVAVLLLPDVIIAVTVLAAGLVGAEWLGVWEELGGRG